MKRKILIIFIILTLIVLKLLILPFDFFDKEDYSKVVYDRNGELLRVYLNDQEQFVLPLTNEKIPEKLKESVIFFEDKNFYKHHGVDISAILRAFYLNIKNKKVISGASTITMQNVRIFRGGKRSYFNKIIEAIYAVQIDFKYTKDEILAIYLNHCPYGGNVRGYRTASLRYFNKVVNDLTWAEAATLAILPNSPSLLNAEKNREKFLKKRNDLLKDLYEGKKLSQEDYILSINESLPETLYALPQKAFHFSDYAINFTEEDIVKTTLDYSIQKIVGETYSYYKENFEKFGVYNTGIIVLDTNTREILGYYTGDYEEKHGRRIDTNKIQRSSGSTLKPFLYNLAFDKGLISEYSLLEDVPSHFGNFNPINSDRQYRGLVSAKEALQKSLNVPMIKLMEKVGYREFYKLMEDYGIKNLREPEEYGLGIVLGTIELSPLELVNMYATLGNLGYHKELKVLLNQESEGKRLYSKGASSLTLDILRGVQRTNKNWEYIDGTYEFYWKTGTSFGERDSWAVGTNSEYTIVVWNGNVDNSSSNILKGIRASAPILFDIMDKISNINGQIEKDSLEEVLINNNGYRSKYENTESAYMPIGVNLLYDPYEKEVFVDENNNEVDSRNWVRGEYKKVVVNDYPSNVKYYLSLRGYKDSGIKKINTNKDFKFFYPQNYMKIKMNNIEEDKLVVEAIGVEGVKEYYWYLNDSYIGSTNKAKNYIIGKKGLNRIDLITDNNLSTYVNFYLE